MAKRISEKLSTTFAEHILLPSLTTKKHHSQVISLVSPLTRFVKGKPAKISLNIPLVSAVMQAVSGADLAAALAKEGGIGFIFCSQPIIDQAKMVAEAKKAKVGPNPLALIDSRKKLIIGAGVNTRDYQTRVPALVRAGVDVLVIDTSDGYSEHVRDTLVWIKKHYPKTPVGAGNVVTKEAYLYLVKAGADFVKVGIGGGSICITQEVKGLGRGQVTALEEIAKARDQYFKKKKIYVPVCSDGGLVQDSHIILALAFGADFVMMGRYFARCEESPTKKRITADYGVVKPYWGEGSARAKNWQRYHQSEKKLPFEEGVEGFVPYAGYLGDVVEKSLKIIKATMRNLGCLNIRDLHRKAVIERRSPGSVIEGKPHDIHVNSDNLGSYQSLYWGK